MSIDDIVICPIRGLMYGYCHLCRQEHTKQSEYPSKSQKEFPTDHVPHTNC